MLSSLTSSDQYVIWAGITYEYLLQQYVNNVNSTVRMYLLIDTLILVFWICLLGTSVTVGIGRYLKQLSVEIGKTRSMLNMLPNSIICNNPELKKAFLSKAFIRNIR